MIRVLVNGAHGKMGQEVIRAVQADPELEIVAECDLGNDLSQTIAASKAQVVVDFTTATNRMESARAILHSGARPVIGTSGFREEEVRELQGVAKQKGVGGVIAPNFALGAVLMMKFAAEAAKYFSHVEIIELHHNQKADSPSGTAVKTAELIAAARAQTPSEIKEVEIVPGARGAEYQGIHIHSVRLPGYVAHQEVIFGGTAQTLTLRHDSNHRESFMPGVCLACKKVLQVSELYYGLEHLLD